MQVQKQPAELENILANHISDKKFASRLFKELLQLNYKKTNHPILTQTMDLNKNFSKEDM